MAAATRDSNSSGDSTEVGSAAELSTGGNSEAMCESIDVSSAECCSSTISVPNAVGNTFATSTGARSAGSVTGSISAVDAAASASNSGAGSTSISPTEGAELNST